jgi:hypothetical protein
MTDDGFDKVLEMLRARLPHREIGVVVSPGESRGILIVDGHRVKPDWLREGGVVRTLGSDLGDLINMFVDEIAGQIEEAMGAS